MTRTSPVLIIGAEDEENLAIRTLAAFLLQRGIPARVVGYSAEEHAGRVLAAVRRNRPPVIAVSIAFQSLAHLFFRLIERIRDSGYTGHIVVGGHFPTFEYRRILETQKGIDSVGRFEGEHCLDKLVQAVACGKTLVNVPNLAYRAPDGSVDCNPSVHAFVDPDQLPFPLRQRHPHVRLGERFATLVSSRGCWHCSCAYCCIGAFHADKQRKFILRSAESVVEEISLLHRRKGIRLFQFHDDNFVLPSCEATSKRLRELRVGMDRRGMRPDSAAFLVKARPDTIDESVACELARLGCVGVFLGVENASESGLQALIRGASLADVERAIGALPGHGMSVTYNLLMFHPHATLDEVNQNIAFAKRHLSIPFDFGRAEIVAGSPLEKLVVQEQRLRGCWPNWDYVMDDASVQQMFDINMETFRAKEIQYSRLAHSLMALSYHAHALNRLHPGPIAERLLDACSSVIIEANRFIIGCIEEMRDCATDTARAFHTAQLRNTLMRGCAHHLLRARSLRTMMLRLQTASRVYGFFGVGLEFQRQRTLARLLGCDVRPFLASVSGSPQGPTTNRSEV